MAVKVLIKGTGFIFLMVAGRVTNIRLSKVFKIPSSFNSQLNGAADLVFSSAQTQPQGSKTPGAQRKGCLFDQSGLLQSAAQV